MNVYECCVAAFYDGTSDSLFLREGPIFVSANSYTEVEDKFSKSSRYGERKVEEIKLLGPLDNLSFRETL